MAEIENGAQCRDVLCKTEAFESLCELIRKRLRSPADAPGAQPNWGLPSSYDEWIADDQKRKVAISSAVDGWIAGVESKEVLDFALLQNISASLGVDVLAVQLSEVSGYCGYARCSSGALAEHRFSEDDHDPVGTILEFLRRNGVKPELNTFRDAVQLRKEGWVLVSAADR